MIQAQIKTQGRRNQPINLTYGCTLDNNVYSYKMVEGIKVFRGVKLGYGWQEQRFNPSCKKGEGEMKKDYTRDELIKVFADCGYKINPFCRAIHKNWQTAKEMLIENGIIDEDSRILATPADIEQTPKPAETKPEPAQGEASAQKIIPETGTTEETLVKCEGCGQGSELGPELRKWITPLGERVCYDCYLKSMDRQAASKTYPLTSAKLDEIADDRRSALSRYCENQAVASLRKRWAGEVFENHEISRGRKLDLIGWLIDAGVEA